MKNSHSIIVSRMEESVGAWTDKYMELEIKIQGLTAKMEGNKGGSQFKPKSMMELKAFSRVEVFKGVGWVKWKSKFESLTRLTYPKAMAILKGCAKAPSEISEQEFKLEGVSAEDIECFSADLVVTLQFLLEGEPYDILCNNTGSGLELWRRLDKRYNSQARSR